MSSHLQYIVYGTIRNPPPAYRFLLRANKKHTPIGNQVRVRGLVKNAFRGALNGVVGLQEIDRLMTATLLKANRSDVPEHIHDNLELYMLMRGLKKDGSRLRKDCAPSETSSK